MIDFFMALCAGLTLVVVVLGGIIKHITNNMTALWNETNQEKKNNSSFREHVASHYMRKDEAERHISLRLDSLLDRMSRTEQQLEQINTSFVGFNQLLPALIDVLDAKNKGTGNG